MRLTKIGIAAVMAGLTVMTSLEADEPQQLSDAAFQSLHKLISRQAGESRWMEIDWYPNVWEARQQAAKQGKPMFLMAGSGGAPSTGC